MDTKIKVMNETYLILSNPHILVRLNTAANRVKHQKTIEKRLFEESTPIHDQFSFVIANIEPANPGISVFSGHSTFTNIKVLDKQVYRNFRSYFTQILVDKGPKGTGYTNKISLIHKGQEILSKTFTGLNYLCDIYNNDENDRRIKDYRRRRLRYEEKEQIQREGDMECSDEILTPFKLSYFDEFNFIENKYQRCCAQKKKI